MAFRLRSRSLGLFSRKVKWIFGLSESRWFDLEEMGSFWARASSDDGGRRRRCRRNLGSRHSLGFGLSLPGSVHRGFGFCFF